MHAPDPMACIQEHALQHPALQALRHGATSISYGQLWQRACGLAGALRAAGVQASDAVAVVGTRGPGMVIGACGSLLAGAAFLLVEAEGMAGPRLREQLEEVRPRLVLRCGPAPLPDGFPALTIDPRDGSCATAAACPAPALQAEGAGYLVFSSGTTGRPRGIRGSRAGLAHFLAWQRDCAQTGPHTRVAHVTGLGFDVVLREIFLPLTSGGCLLIPDEEQRLDPRRLLPWLEQQAISLLHTVPTLAGFWLEERPAEVRLPALRRVFFAGEALHSSLVERWRAAFPHSATGLYNLYGPSETTLARCCYPIPQPAPEGVQALGWPLPDTFVGILADEQLVPPGTRGEIVIASPFRSLGGLRGSPLFEIHAARPQEPWYRSGDRGWLDADGLLHFAGRLDHQTKIHGVRVEPEGVAARLRAHPEVRDAGVLVVEGPRLVAFLVGTAPEERLRSWLLERLPGACLPARFLRLEALPRTARGKLDRAALRTLLAQADALPAGTSAPEAPARRGDAASALAVELAGLFGEVLGRAVEPEQSFLAAGGDSLQVLVLLARMRVRWGRSPELARFFAAPSAQAVAGWLAGQQGPAAPLETPLLPVQRGGPLPVSPIQERLWLHAQLEPEAAYNLLVAVHSEQGFAAGALAKALEHLCERHEVLRSRFPLQAGRPVQVVDCASRVSLQAEPAEVDRKRLGEAELRRRFDLEKEHPLRARLLQEEDGSELLLLTVHHLAFDAWSRPVLLRDLAALLQDPPAGLPRLPVQVADLAAWQRARPAVPAAMDYWRAQLRDVLPLPLPTARPRPDRQDYRAGSCRARLSGQQVAALAALAADQQATLFQVLLAGFQLLLHGWTGAHDITCGAPFSQRDRPELSDLIGCCIHLFALRNDCRGALSFVEFLQRVRATCLQALQHREVDFGQVVAEVCGPRDLRRHPLFDVLFNFLERPPLPEAPPGISFPTLVPPLARFALTLYLKEVQGSLSLVLVYQQALFDEPPMQALLDDFSRLLAALCARPNAPLRSLLEPLRSTREGILPTPAQASVVPLPAPSQAIEQVVTEVWEELLGCRPARSDNFFALGGHSLLALQARSRLQERLGLELPLRALFQTGSLAALGQELARAKVRGASAAAPGRGKLPLTAAQRRYLQTHGEAGASLVIPRAVWLRGPLEPDRLAEALQLVCARHPVLLSSFHEGPEGCWQEPEAFALPRLEVEDLASASEFELAARLRALGEKPLARTGPQVEFQLWRRSASEHLLCLRSHHLVADCFSLGIPVHGEGWRAGVLFPELLAVYAALADGAPLPAPPARFSDFVTRQVCWLAGAEADAQRRAWRSRLAGAEALELPADGRRPAAGEHTGRRLALRLPAPLSERLRQLARAHGATCTTAVVAAFKAFLAKLSGQEDLCVATMSANRQVWDLPELVGPLANTLLLRSQVPQNASFRSRLQAEREALAFAFAHQQLPSEEIAAELPFRARCLLHRVGPARHQAAGLRLEPHTVPRELSKVDLSLVLVDRGRGALSGWLESSRALFSDATAQGQLDGLLACIEASLAAPEEGC